MRACVLFVPLLVPTSHCLRPSSLAHLRRAHFDSSPCRPRHRRLTRVPPPAGLRSPERSSLPGPLPTTPPTSSLCRSSTSRRARSTLPEYRPSYSPGTGRPPHHRRSTQLAGLGWDSRPTIRSFVSSPAPASCMCRNPIRPETLDGNGMRRSVFSFVLVQRTLFGDRLGDLSCEALWPVLHQALRRRRLPVDVQSLDLDQRCSDHQLVDACLHFRC